MCYLMVVMVMADLFTVCAKPGVRGEVVGGGCQPAVMCRDLNLVFPLKYRK